MGDEFVITKIQFSVTIILVMIVSITGFTYAYFAISASDSNTITGSAATVDLTLRVEKKFPLASVDNTGVLVPQLSTSLSNALRSGCVDGNGNIICQVYEIAIKNNGGSATQVVDGMVSFYGNSGLTVDINTVMPNLRWKLITSIDTGVPSNSVLGGNSDLIASRNSSIFADDVLLNTGREYVYYMIVWIDETNEEQDIDEGSSFYAVVEFDSSNGTGVTSTFTS